MKTIVVFGIIVAGLVVLGLNPGFIADNVLQFAKQYPKYANTPDYVFQAGRVCQIIQGGDQAIELYNYLYQTYPDNEALCAPAMYYCGKIKAEASYMKVFRVQALPYLQIVIDQYPKQQEWVDKAQKLMNEVNGLAQ